MSLTDLPRDPEAPTDFIDDDVLDTLAPGYSAADVEELRSLVHGPVYAAATSAAQVAPTAIAGVCWTATFHVATSAAMPSSPAA